MRNASAPFPPPALKKKNVKTRFAYAASCAGEALLGLSLSRPLSAACLPCFPGCGEFERLMAPGCGDVEPPALVLIQGSHFLLARRRVYV